MFSLLAHDLPLFGTVTDTNTTIGYGASAHPLTGPQMHGWGMAWSDVLVHDCGPMGNDCHLAQGPLGEGPLTAATPKVEGDFYAVRPRHFNIMRR